MGIIIALLSGALMSVQGVLNTAVTKQSSIWTAAGWVQISAFVAGSATVYASGRNTGGADYVYSYPQCEQPGAGPVGVVNCCGADYYCLCN